MSVPVNLKHPLRTGYILLDKAHGMERFGTVIRTGKMQKTCTVEVSNYRFIKKYRMWVSRRKRFHCHDPDEFWWVGDKVIIRQCLKLSNIKYFYVRNVVLPIGRNSFYAGKLSKDEIDAISYNEELRKSSMNELII